MSASDWGLYRKCPACKRPIGQPCQAITGQPMRAPHRERRLRKVREQ